MGNRPPFQAGTDYTIVRVTLAGQRRMGADFDTAWRLALRLARKEDRRVLKETESAWRRAYAGESVYSGQAFSMLATHTDEHHDTMQLAV